MKKQLLPPQYNPADWRNYKDKRDGKIVLGKPIYDMPKFIVYKENGIEGVVVTGIKHFELADEQSKQ